MKTKIIMRTLDNQLKSWSPRKLDSEGNEYDEEQ